jgi:hypothetical protein
LKAAAGAARARVVAAEFFDQFLFAVDDAGATFDAGLGRGSPFYACSIARKKLSSLGFLLCMAVTPKRLDTTRWERAAPAASIARSGGLRLAGGNGCGIFRGFLHLTKLHCAGKSDVARGLMVVSLQAISSMSSLLANRLSS